MKKTIKNHERLQYYFALQRVIVIATYLMLISGNILGQANTMWHMFDEDVKNYATKVIPNTNGVGAVMAGTKFDANGNGTPHFIRVDDNTPDGYPNIVVDKLYPDTKFADQRVVDIVVKQEGEYYIIVLARDNGILFANGKDFIKIIKVDDNGNNKYPPLVGNGDGGERIYHDPMNDYNMYPMSAMYRETDDGNGIRELLYICGYVTTEATQFPSEPNYNSKKQSFLLNIDVSQPDPATWSVQNIKYYETSPSTSTNPNELDWDMAMRMQTLENNTNWLLQGTNPPYTNAIFMTGSVNFMSGAYNGTNNNTYVRSGTAVYLLDPWTLNEIYGNTHISNFRHGEDGRGYLEYGVGIVESDDGEHNYIISNMYSRQSIDGYGTPPNDWFLQTTLGSSYNAKVNNIAITHTNNSFATMWNGNSTKRLFLTSASSGIYGVQVLPTRAPSNRSGTSAVRFLIAGMAINRSQSTECSQMWQYSPNSYIGPENIIPYLWDLDISFTPDPNNNPLGILGDINYDSYSLFGPQPPAPSTIFYYKNQTSTGDPNIYSNSYARLGKGLSNIFYSPKFVDRDINTSTIVMNAPKFGSTKPTINNKLGLKTMYLTDAGVSPVSYSLDGGCFTGCGQDMMDHEIELTSSTNTSPFIQDDPSDENPVTMPYYLMGDCSGFYSGTPVFKPGPTSVENTINDKEISLYPNPANDIVTIATGQAMWNNVSTIEVSDITGRLISTINAAPVDLKLQINTSTWASGTYLVNITMKDNSTVNKKLVISK